MALGRTPSRSPCKKHHVALPQRPPPLALQGVPRRPCRHGPDQAVQPVQQGRFVVKAARREHVLGVLEQIQGPADLVLRSRQEELCNAREGVRRRGESKPIGHVVHLVVVGLLDHPCALLPQSDKAPRKEHGRNMLQLAPAPAPLRLEVARKTRRVGLVPRKFVRARGVQKGVPARRALAEPC